MKKWLSPVPKVCDICQKPIKTDFIDGKTVHGPWAVMCELCHCFHGVGLGLGKGQKYVKDSEGSFIQQ